MARRRRDLRDGRVAMVVAAAWALFDALVHVAVDQVEPPRIAGNVSVMVGAALVLVPCRFGRRVRLAAAICGLATVLVFGFNLAWVQAEGELPIPAAVFIGVSLALTLWAASRFLAEARSTSDGDT